MIRCESGSVVSNSLWPRGLYSPWNSPDQNTRVGSLSLLQGIFPTQGSNPGLLHCRRILCQLSHRGSPRILECVTILSPGDFPDSGIKLRSLHCSRILYQLHYPGSPTYKNHWSSSHTMYKIYLKYIMYPYINLNIYILQEKLWEKIFESLN